MLGQLLLHVQSKLDDVGAAFLHEWRGCGQAIGVVGRVTATLMPSHVVLAHVVTHLLGALCVVLAVILIIHLASIFSFD